ncbi:MAG: hypothetical protein KF749_01605 [Bacteroidetes bacterium]|nr:hypothetical protein [Bacteroidota bacterium]MCW5896210.1 hypothetical protein [Bacteroidota bacterium]
MNFAMRVLCIVLVVILISGCQDDPITNPVTDLSNPTVGCSKRSPETVIPYDLVLRDPTQMFNGWIEVHGTITYSLTVLPIIRETRVSVVGVNEARLWPMGEEGLVWTISCKSGYSCCIPAGGMGELHCAFPVEGRRDGLVLRATMRVSTDRMEVDRMWLDAPKPPLPDDF